MRAVKSVSIDSARRVIITYLDGSTETLYPNCIWCDSEALRELIKDLLEEKADAITQTIKNVTVATFSDGADEGMIKNLLVSIEPVQDLHGYDNPWPAGGGKNKCAINEANRVGWAIPNSALLASVNALPNGTYCFHLKATITEVAKTGHWASGAEFQNQAGNITFRTTVSEDATVGAVNIVSKSFSITDANRGTFTACYLYGCGSNAQPRIGYADLSEIQIESGSSFTSFAPYSNICPISGFEGLTVTRTAINVWDEEWENGTFNTTTGVNINTTSTNRQIRSKNARIPVKGGESYYFKWINSSAIGGLWTMFFDADENIITDFVPSGDYVDKSGNCCLFRNRVVEVPENAAFCKFYCTFDYGDTYNHDISINYPATDTEYHAYKGSTYSVNWESEAGTVYGGSLDVVSGKLVVDRANIASYNGEALPATWLSDRDVYAEGTTPSTGAEVVYKLAEPVEYQLTPQEVTTLLGTNNIWADSGKILELEYAADTKLYIGEQQSASSGTLGMANRPTVVDKQFEPVAEITDTDSEVTE